MRVLLIFARQLYALGCVLLVLSATPASAFETAARAGILVDAETGQVLFETNPDQPLPPASMSKLMTVLMLFERLRDGSLDLDETLPVSEKAWRKGGSKMFVEVGTRVRVEDLIRGIIVQSGNDACIVVAEGLAGSERSFADLMNRRAAELGLENTHLTNASGWPHPDHLMSVRDLATVARILVEEYPDYYGFFAEEKFEFNGIEQRSRNPLLRRGIGVDGLKTGYTNDAGYGLVASAERDGRRLIAVLAGLETAGAGARESERLLEYGFRQFENYRLFVAGEPVVEADVWLGDAGSVPLVAREDVAVTLSREARRDLEVKLIYETPIPAPVRSGTELAHLEIVAPGLEPRRVALYAASDVQSANLFGRVQSALGYLIWGRS
ncbi:MAG: D-alanyl-D-alanine carboxypeptidase family protein [Geminicoccaceae bacterium]|nr:D-alanyl-D-alanine carboxypeptidase family protein [Geminicoccaceae bacterium]